MIFPPRVCRGLAGALFGALGGLVLVLGFWAFLAPALAEGEAPKLAVPPVLGLESAPAGALAEAMAGMLARRGLRAEAGTGAGDFIISGRARAGKEPGTLLWARIYWTVKAPDGRTWQTGAQEIPADPAKWAAGEARTMRHAAAETGGGVLRILAQLGLKIGPEPVEPEPEPPESAESAPWPDAPVFWVRAVSGAPGEGGRELTAAMRRALAGRGAGAAAAAAEATHFVQGAVSMSDVFAGTQRARIIWRVTTAQGAPIGTATQENEITAGALDGDWGALADDIAAAAANGIQKLFGR